MIDVPVATSEPPGTVDTVVSDASPGSGSPLAGGAPLLAVSVRTRGERACSTTPTSDAHKRPAARALNLSLPDTPILTRSRKAFALGGVPSSLAPGAGLTLKEGQRP